MATTSSEAPVLANIASHLPAMAARQPDALAAAAPTGTDRQGRVTYSRLTFRELDRWSDQVARGLEAVGLRRGMRTALMVTPGLEFFCLTFALFKMGAVPVVVDPGIGLPNLKKCLGEAAPEAFVGVPKAHAARLLLGWARDSIRVTVTTGSWPWCAGVTLGQVMRFGAADEPYPTTTPGAEEPAAILFTSGSTGPPKGAVYTHANFNAQVEALRDAYGIEPGEVDLCTFPLFALFAPALGMSSIVPEMDPTRPAKADPQKILRAVEDWGVTNLFGSPALLNTVGRWGASQGRRLPTLRRVISAGAPVPAAVMERFAGMLAPGVQVWSGYGATEALPVATIGSAEILGETRRRTDEGRGVCVGRPVGGTRVTIMPISDDPVPVWEDARALPANRIGEIAVAGPVVTREYFRRPESTRLAKMERTGGGFLHRMGDLGYFDDQGRLWFCGRKSQRVVTDLVPGGVLYTIPCEAVFNTHPSVFRSALVRVERNGRVEPALCVELEASARQVDRVRLTKELLALGERHETSRCVKTILFHPGFPVDIRHNAKIGREALGRWAQARLS